MQYPARGAIDTVRPATSRTNPQASLIRGQRHRIEVVGAGIDRPAAGRRRPAGSARRRTAPRRPWRGGTRRRGRTAASAALASRPAHTVVPSRRRYGDDAGEQRRADRCRPTAEQVLGRRRARSTASPSRGARTAPSSSSVAELLGVRLELVEQIAHDTAAAHRRACGRRGRRPGCRWCLRRWRRCGRRGSAGRRRSPRRSPSRRGPAARATSSRCRRRCTDPSRAGSAGRPAPANAAPRRRRRRARAASARSSAAALVYTRHRMASIHARWVISMRRTSGCSMIALASPAGAPGARP